MVTCMRVKLNGGDFGGNSTLPLTDRSKFHVGERRGGNIYHSSKSKAYFTYYYNASSFIHLVS